MAGCWFQQGVVKGRSHFFHLSLPLLRWDTFPFPARPAWPPWCLANTPSCLRATLTAGVLPSILQPLFRKDTNFSQMLLFTSCSDDEFTCLDGLCVTMDLRCNQIIDCPNDRCHSSHQLFSALMRRAAQWWSSEQPTKQSLLLLR